MGDEEIGEIALCWSSCEQVHDLGLHRDVERRDRLVADHELWAQRERACQADPLPLAAGELVGVAVGGIAGKPNHVEELVHALSGLASRADAVDRSGSPTIRPTECRGLSDA